MVLSFGYQGKEGLSMRSKPLVAFFLARSPVTRVFRVNRLHGADKTVITKLTGRAEPTRLVTVSTSCTELHRP